MYINGNWMEAASGHTFQSYNPANGESVGSVPAGNDVDTVNAIDAAAAAFPRWSSQTAYERSRFCTWPTA
jgi:succinate-semialdehyde dehydrogenase/glutarate-semialdehyde dehydrogenase